MKKKRKSTNIRDLTGPRAHLAEPENFAQHLEDPAIGQQVQDDVRTSLPAGRGQDYALQKRMTRGDRRRGGGESAPWRRW